MLRPTFRLIGLLGLASLACGGRPVPSGGLDGTGSSGGSSSSADSTGVDETGDPGGDGAPDLAMVVVGGEWLPHVADVTPLGVAGPPLHPVVEAGAAFEGVDETRTAGRWAAYNLRSDRGGQLVLHDLRDAPYGPLHPIDGVPPGDFRFEFDQAGTSLAVAAWDDVDWSGYWVPLGVEPGPAVPLSGTSDQLLPRMSPSGDFLWAFGLAADTGLGTQLYVTPIVDEQVDPLVPVTDFSAVEAGASWPLSVVAPHGIMFMAGEERNWGYYAGISGWPEIEAIPLVPPSDGVDNEWFYSEDASRALRVYHGPEGDGVESISIVDGQVQPPVPVDVPSTIFEGVLLTPGGSFAVFWMSTEGQNLGVAWLDGPNPSAVEMVATVPTSIDGSVPSPVVFDDGAAWISSAGPLQVISLADTGIGDVQTASPHHASSLRLSDERLFYRVDDPPSHHVAEALWMIDLRGPEPAEPVAVTQALPEGSSPSDIVIASPLDDRLFYYVYSKGPELDVIKSVWSREVGVPGSETLLLADEASFVIRLFPAAPG